MNFWLEKQYISLMTVEPIIYSQMIQFLLAQQKRRIALSNVITIQLFQYVPNKLVFASIKRKIAFQSDISSVLVHL